MHWDPGSAGRLDDPDRDRFLPTGPLLDLLALDGAAATVLDYGAGTGRFSLAVARRLDPGGRVVGVESSDEMLALLRERVAAAEPGTATLIEAIGITEDRVPLDDGSVDAILAVDVLHHIVVDRALAEMRRLLRPDGTLLLVDWERGRERPTGPPDDVLSTAAEAADTLRAARFDVRTTDVGLSYHYVLRAGR
jgi:SAM-dependent methyltransferase